MVSFAINESRLSDTRCLIKDVVSPQLMIDATLHETFSAELICHDVIPLVCMTKHIYVNKVSIAMA
jgi:hypothetical protein